MDCVVLIFNTENFEFLVQFLHAESVVSLLVHLLIPLPVVLMQLLVRFVEQFVSELLILGIFEFTESKLANTLTLLTSFKLLVLLV
jgi:hypothetical protein